MPKAFFEWKKERISSLYTSKFNLIKLKYLFLSRTKLNKMAINVNAISIKKGIHVFFDSFVRTPNKLIVMIIMKVEKRLSPIYEMTSKRPIVIFKLL